MTVPTSAESTAFFSTQSITRPANTTAYDASDLIGERDAATPANAGNAIIVLPGIGPAGGTVLMRKMRLEIEALSVPSGMTSFRVHLFNASPTAILDNAPFVGVVAADTKKYLGYVTLGTVADLGAMLAAGATEINEEFTLAAGDTSLYALVETVGGFTPASETVFTLESHATAL
jgi:hypothetical protein